MVDSKVSSMDGSSLHQLELTNVCWFLGAKLQGFLVYQAVCFVHAREEPSFEDLVVRFQLRV